METYIAYFDESGDDGFPEYSCEFFVLTSLYLSAETWQQNFDVLRACRESLKDRFGLHVSEELHTKQLLSDKDPYRKYGWSPEQKQEIIIAVTKCLSTLKAKSISVVIDKTHIAHPDYSVLEKALTYNIQRIENDSHGAWKYIIITDKGRLAPMRRTARAIRAYNPIPSKYSPGYTDQPVQNLIEDILEKDSAESYFIQACDFISYFVHLYYKTAIKKEALPNRVGRVIDPSFAGRVMATLKQGGLLNLKANALNPYGLVIYPK